MWTLPLYQIFHNCFIQTVPCLWKQMYVYCCITVNVRHKVWSTLKLISSSWVFRHLQESAKNTSLPSLFDPLTLALYSNSILLKKKTSFSNLFVFYILVFFLFIIKLTKAIKSSNTSLLYSFSILSVFFLLYNLKKPCYVYCVKLTETFYSTCMSLLFCWFWLLPLSSFVSRFG